MGEKVSFQCFQGGSLVIGGLHLDAKSFLEARFLKSSAGQGKDIPISGFHQKDACFRWVRGVSAVCACQHEMGCTMSSDRVYSADTY
jgi:hypothetical protein